MTKKFMRKVLVSVDVDIDPMHVWVDSLDTEEDTLEMVKEAINEDMDILTDNAGFTISAKFVECRDEEMDDQAVTEEDGWVHVSDLVDDEGNRIEPTSDPRYLDPDYQQSGWCREELEKAGQLQLPLKK